jgi:hypothetical protein
MSDDRLARVERACAELAEAGDAVTFVAVADRSHIPRVTLYRNPTLRALVEECRARSKNAHTLSGLSVEVTNLRVALEAVAERVRHHEELLRRLSKTRLPKPTK